MRETRRRLLITLAGATAGVVAARSAYSAQRPVIQPVPSPNSPANQNAPAGLDNAGVQEGGRKPTVSPLAWTQIKTDAQKLFQITSEFKDHVEQTNLASTLPLLKEAHQIEKLAKRIQDQMKNA